MKARHCPQCDNPRSTPEGYGQDGWRVVRCASCGFVHLDALPAYEELAEEFEWSKSFEAEHASRKKKYPLLQALDMATRFRTSLIVKKNPMTYVRAHHQRGSVVDLGCGNGSYLADNAQGFVLYGIDISAKLAADAHRTFAPTGGSAVAGACHEALRSFGEGAFDAAILRSYLEHEHQPRLVLTELGRTLKPGGTAVVKVPNYASFNRRLMGAKWCGFRFPDHVNYFTPASLAAMAAATGFDCSIRLMDRLPTDDNLWAVLKRPAQARAA